MTISNTPRPAYIYKDGVWYPISSPVNTAANYDWTGAHDFAAAVSFDEVVKAQAGVNNFQNPAARDVALPSPADGTVVFIRQDNNSNTINQIQYYQNSAWVNYSAITIDEKTTSYTIALNDIDKLIKVNSSSNLEVIVPAQSSVNFPIGSRLEIYRAGTGEVAIVAAGGSGVTIRSKLNNNKISVQYSGAMLTKIGSDEWHLIGDLKA
jgi:hypothetical protein